MANRRMINKSISISEQVNNMTIFAGLLFTWMIPHADDFGRMPGSPSKVKALVIPMRVESPSVVESALQEMVENQLIIWYEVDGVQYIQFKTWDKHQTGLHKRTQSSFPEPNSDSETFPEVPRNSRSTELNVTELNRTELKAAADQLPGSLEQHESTPPQLNEMDLESYCREIETHMIASGMRPSYIVQKSDLERVKTLHASDVPISFIKRYITYAYERQQGKVGSFAYCADIVEERWRRQLSMQVPGEPLSFETTLVATRASPSTGRYIPDSMPSAAQRAMQEDEQRARFNSS